MQLIFNQLIKYLKTTCVIEEKMEKKSRRIIDVYQSRNNNKHFMNKIIFSVT